MCADINVEGAQTTAAQIAEHGGRSATMELDVTSEDAVKDALAQTVAVLGGLDVLFNNAGIGGSQYGWDRTIEVNLSGVYYGTFHGAATLAERGGGSIINTASIAGLNGLLSSASTRDIDLEVEEGRGRVCGGEARRGRDHAAVRGDIRAARRARQCGLSGLHPHADDGANPRDGGR